MANFCKTIGFIFLSAVYSNSWIGINSQETSPAKIQLISSNIEKSILTFEVDGFNLVPVHTDDGEKFIVKVDEGTSMLKLGAPDLAKLTSSVIIPDNAKMKVNIVSSEYQDYENVEIAPSKGNLTRKINPDDIPFSYGEAYNNDAFYPGKLAELRNPYILRELRGQTIVVYPFQYNPISKVLRVYTTITLEIESDGVNHVNQLQRSRNSIKVDAEFTSLYSQQFENFDEIRYEQVNEEGSMLVICYDGFMDAMQPLVDWKNMKGIPTELVSLSSIGGTEFDIKNLAQDRYYNNNLAYLLLVGDINQMPSMTVGSSKSDNAFAYMEGNDSYPEFFVGRFSAESISHVNTQVERTIIYERYPDASTDWYHRGLGIASNQGPGDDNEYDDEYVENIRELLLDYTYTDVDAQYDYSGSLSGGINTINEGVSVINYTGHGSLTSWGNGAPLSNNDVNNLTNVNKLPFVWSVACDNGEFHLGTSFAEAWLRATDNGEPTGAIATLMSTISQSWAPPMDGQDEFNDILTESIENNIKRTFGGISMNGCMHMNDNYGSSGETETDYWTVFGDPSVVVRTDTPTEMSINYNESILIGATEFVVDVGFDGALVAISNDGTLITSAYSDGGIAVLDLGDQATSPDTWDVVVTAYNKIPHEAEIAVIAPSGPYVVFDGFVISDDTNFNGQADFNEDVHLSISAVNVGVENAQDVCAYLESDDEYITILEGGGYSCFGNIIAGGENVYSQGDFVFLLAGDVPNGHLIPIDITFSSGSNSWSSTFSVEAHAPVFEIANPLVLDANNDGVWDLGEIAEIQIQVSNTGSSDFMYYPQVNISTSSQHVTFSYDEEIYYGIFAGQTYDVTFTATADASTPTGSEVEFEINWGVGDISSDWCENDCPENAEFSFNAVIGHATILVWDASSTHTSGDRLIEYFDSHGVGGYDYVTSNQAPTVEFYNTAFIFLGIYSDNHVLSSFEAEEFVQLLNNGGNLYLEGGDTWAFDTGTELHNMFGLTGILDGSSDLGVIHGVSGTFTDGMTFNYNGGNNWIDNLQATDGYAILENESPNYVTAVAYDNVSAGYRTIGASHELGGLSGDDSDAYIAGIMDFFDTGGTIEPLECIGGDVNYDENNDITDVVRMVNIIVGIGDPASEDELCAADINSDEQINILDILLNINIILGNTRSSQRGEVVAESVILKESDTELFMDSPGKIMGIELLIEGTHISFNDEMNMEIVSNEKEGKTHALIFSFNRNSIGIGEIKLLDAPNGYEVISFTFVNNVGASIPSFSEEFVKPEEFTLFQNYPNPFNPSTNIRFELNKSQSVSLIVYDITGREIAVLTNDILDAGSHSFMWEGQDTFGNLMPTGMYLYRLENESITETRKMVLMK